MSNGFNFHNTISGDGAQINQGQNVTASQTNNHGGDLTPDQILEQVELALPESERDPVMPEIRSLLSLPLPEQEELLKEASPVEMNAAGEEVPSEPKGRLAIVLDTIAKHRESVLKNLAVFGKGALEAYCRTNPILAGIHAVCVATSEAEEPNSWEVYGRGRYSDRGYSGSRSTDSWGEDLTR